MSKYMVVDVIFPVVLISLLTALEVLMFVNIDGDTTKRVLVITAIKLEVIVLIIVIYTKVLRITKGQQQ